MDTALVNVCDRFKVSVDAIKTQALCLNEPVFSEYAQADLIDQFTELFTELVISEDYNSPSKSLIDR